MKFPIKDFFSKCDQTLNGKLHFLCSERGALMKNAPDSVPVIICFYGFDSPKVKRDMISSIIDFELKTKDLLKLGNIKEISKLDEDKA